MGHAPGFRDITNPVMIPHHKADFNNNGPVSTDYIGHSWKYPEATYAEKAALWQDHLVYTESFFLFHLAGCQCAGEPAGGGESMGPGER
jgi:hypothetical protein